jgi:hypothetical protein
MQKISRSNLKFIRLVRHLRDHAGLDVRQAVRFVVLSSTDCYVYVELGPSYMPLGKDVHNINQLSLVMEKLGL